MPEEERFPTPAVRWRGLLRHITLYRLVTGIGFIIAMVLVFTAPVQMPDPDDWAYYHGVRNFSEGRLTVDNNEQFRQARETEREGNFLLQYLPIEFNTWALEKAPGVVFYLVPFYKIGVPRLGNAVLALATVIVTWLLLKRLRDEKAAMIGSLLILFTPIALVMLNRLYMDTYASLAFLVTGGGLYLLHHLQRHELSPVKGGLLLFPALLFIGWSVITRYTNLPIAVVLGLHYLVVRFVDWRRGRPLHVAAELAPIIAGIALPLAGFLVYNNAVFGSPLKYGYSFSPFPISFAFQYIGQEYGDGLSVPLQILRYNIPAMLRNAWIGFPLLVVGVPAFIVMLYRAVMRPRPSPEGGTRRVPDIPRDILLVMALWFLAVFLLYLGYEWTAGLQKGGGFVIFDRFLLPGLFPIVIVSALALTRFPWKFVIPVIAILVVFGSLLYAQWAWDLHILPDFLTEWTLESRWPDSPFPPWFEFEPFWP